MRVPNRTTRAARALVGAVVAVVVLVQASAASATWSVVAVDPETGLVGGAMASCLRADILGNPDEAFAPLILVPGAAVGVAQGNIEFETPGTMRRLIGLGSTPDEVIEGLLANDAQAASRQFAVVTGGPGPTDPDPQSPLAGVRPVDAAAYTGEGSVSPSGDSTQVADEPFSVQGVSLADEATVPAAADAFEAARKQGRSFDRALVDALVAGSEAGGDARCEEQTALFAHLAVAEPDDDPVRPSLVLTVVVDQGDGQNPVMLLDEFLDDGRTGWIDVGRNDPSGLPRLVVLAVATLLAIGALTAIWTGLGNRSARR